MISSNPDFKQGDTCYYKGNLAKIMSYSNTGNSVWITVPLQNGSIVGINTNTYMLSPNPQFKSTRKTK